jgi:ABC-type branched-subunit amino acid transport system ATPase component
VITIEGLWAGYGGLDILRGVDLQVDTGTITCIVGPNGAGKSTVLKTISGLLAPRTGSIVVDGVDLSGRSPRTVLQAGVVQVPQRHGLFAKLTVRRNVEMGAYIHRRDRRRISARYEQLAQMFPLLADRPQVLAGSLSGGQRRIVEFARAMMLDPTVVLLDEPTLGLDPVSLTTIQDSIRTMNGDGITVLMVEQNVRFGLSLADRATVMSAGRVAVSGPAQEVAAAPDLMDVFFGAATHGDRRGRAGGASEPIAPPGVPGSR